MTDKSQQSENQSSEQGSTGAPGAERNLENLLGYDRAALTELLAPLGGKPFHAKQMLKWMHSRGVDDINLMTDLSKALRDKLQLSHNIASPEVIERIVSTDGTRKWLLRSGAGQAIEMVFIPETNRGTLCISSQVGCALDCSFCSTGAQGFNRNLNSAEIVAQVWLASRELSAADAGVITNVVFMGMGEPLANYRHVLPALNILTDDFAYMLSRRRVTVSTSGLVPQINKLAVDSNVALAVSLHAPNNQLRDQLVPINRKHPIAALLDSCWSYLKETGGRSVTFEYTMIAGVNDSTEHARELARLLKKQPAKVNLIPFNPFPGNDFRRSPAAKIRAFRDVLHRADIRATIRKTRGDDIDAACGQLAGQVTDRTKVRLGSKQFNVVSL